ncbi:MAG: hypothetical protein IJQ81_06145, partial [Oscillibacter sp.]|nr:hypothetical protein [Oscillibacter sp.]
HPPPKGEGFERRNRTGGKKRLRETPASNDNATISGRFRRGFVIIRRIAQTETLFIIAEGGIDSFTFPL